MQVLPTRFEGQFMGIAYFKRFQMQIDVSQLAQRGVLADAVLPTGYHFRSWHRSLLELHATAKYRCFKEEIDAHVFSCLGNREGCLRLMNEISRRNGFLAAATWLIEYKAGGEAHHSSGSESCATIQGVVEKKNHGTIQNVAVVPEHRGAGLGRLLVLRCLAGFWQSGVQYVTLEVTANNRRAVALYERLGFRHTKTLYKAVELAYF